MNYRYFRDPKNFSFICDEKGPCSVCGEIGLWFDAQSFYGTQDLDSVCDACLKGGKLIDLDVSTNYVRIDLVEKIFPEKKKLEELTNEIVYKTPSLPSWQDLSWPFVENDFCIFEKIASKIDFILDGVPDKNLFMSSFSEDDADNSDLNWLWETLSEHPITNLKDGNYDMTVYLFSTSGKPFCTWDAN
jgi:uncharacterized protein CbrC (UPF0167 family)